MSVDKEQEENEDIEKGSEAVDENALPAEVKAEHDKCFSNLLDMYNGRDTYAWR